MEAFKILHNCYNCTQIRDIIYEYKTNMAFKTLHNCYNCTQIRDIIHEYKTNMLAAVFVLTLSRIPLP